MLTFIERKSQNCVPDFNHFELLYGMGYSCLRIFSRILGSCGYRVL